MGKIIKKSVKFLIIFLGILIMFPTMLYFAIQIPAVQTGLVKRITNHFSAQLQSTISIGRIDYKFFNRLALSNILIKDRNSDTLLYAKKVTAGLRHLDLKGKNFRFGRIVVAEPKMALITDSTGQMNLAWYLAQLKSPSDTIKKAGASISIDRIDLHGASFALINREPDTAKSKSKIDFKNFRLDSINGIVEDLEIKNDTTNLTVYELSCREQSGLSLNRLSGSFRISGPDILFRSLFIHTDNSVLNLSELGLKADSASGFRDFVDGVRLNIQLEKSIISTTDIGYFVALPDGLDETLNLAGKFAGTISELRGRDVMLSYGNYTSLDCNFDLSGLPDIENAYIYIGVNSLKTNARDIERMKIPLKKKFIVPEALYKLGNITFNGSFTGFTTDFVTYGEFRTDQGDIRTDISLRPDESNTYRIQGLLNGNSINLGELADSRVLGRLNIKANVDGIASSLKKFAGNLKGTIDSIEINKYSYRNIDLNGNFTEKTWDGSINVEDQNIKMDLLGMLNFNDTLPEFDFTLNLVNANLFKLKIDPKDSTSAISMLLTSNFRGSNIDNMDGEIKLLNSTITKNGKTIDLYDFSMRSYNQNSLPALSLRTDFVNADINGRYNLRGLKSLFSSALASIMPSMFAVKEEKQENAENNFRFDINFRNTDEINEFFKTGLVLAEKSYLRGSVSRDTVINIEGRAPFINFRNIVFNDFSFDAKSSGPLLNAGLSTSSLVLPGNKSLKDFGMNLKTNPDNFTFNVDWDNKEQVLEKGSISATGIVSQSSSGSGRPVLTINIDSTLVYTANTPWTVSRSEITVDSNAIKVDRINITSADRFYKVYGAVSVDTRDTLHLQFRGIDISPLNYIGKKSEKTDTTKLSMDLKGRLSGVISLTNIYRDRLIEGDIMVNKFSILGSEYGDISITGAFNNARRVVEISAGNNLNGTRMFDINGYYDPSYRRINLDFTAKHTPIEILNPLLRSFASGIRGFASGRLNLSGPTNMLVLKGAVKAENASIKIDYLQTVYKLNDSIRFDKEGFRFNNVRFTDVDGRQATINGLVRHTNLRNYSADLTINMGNDFMALNTTLENNPIFYGKVYGSGVVKIKTGPNLLSFDISAKTGKNTKFSIPLNTSLSVSEYPFISFENPATIKENGVKPPPAATKLGLDINIDLTVTPDAVAELIFDPRVGDIMSGSGSGILNITMNPKGEFAIRGDYNIEQGSYLFTLGNIFAKKFDVENGGKIMFNGNLDDAEIDLLAKYRKFNTSLFPILQDEKYNSKISVEPQLLLTGKLFNPTVNFEINLPNSDEDTKAYLKNAIASDEEMSRQFLYLLVTQTFYSEQTNINSGTSNLSGTSAVTATTFEMLSNQLSNWISQINENFNLGLSYKPGSGDKTLNPDEVGVNFETQVLDDRVILNGNFDYKTSAEAAERLTGDFDASLRITDKLRFKVFNRFNNTSFLGSAIRGPYTQGIGIFFRQDFQKVSDLFKKKNKQKAAKEDQQAAKKEEETELKEK
jgi:hypothetical protein